MRLSLILAICLSTPCAAQELGKADPAIQERIQRILATANQRSGDLSENIPAITEAVALKGAVTDKGEIVKQVAIYAGDLGGEEMQPLAGLLLLQLLDLPPKDVIRRLAPHLDSSNPKLRSFVRDWFQSHDNAGRHDPLRPVNYEDYLEYLRSNSFPPAPFIEYVYERSPGRALLLFHRSTRRADAIAALEKVAENIEANRKEAGLAAPRIKPMRPDDFILAEHVVADVIWAKHSKFHEHYESGLPNAKKYLAKLSKHDQWWVRLYVAEIMRQNPDLRIDDVLEELRTDENESVCKAAKELLVTNRDEGKQAKTLAAPREVQTRAIGPTSIEVTWEASEGATTYTVQRRQPDTEAEFTTIAPNVTGTIYKDIGLPKDTLYQYRVIAHQIP